MPPLLLAVVPLVFSLASTALGITGIAATLIGLAGSLLSSLVQTALFGKPATAAKASQPGITQLVRSSEEPRRLIYGEQAVSGVLAFASTTARPNSPTGLLHMVVLLAGHECAAIGDQYLNDIVFDDPQFVVGGNPLFLCAKHLGATDQVADATLIGFDPTWTTAHRLRGIAYVYVRFIWNNSPQTWRVGIPNVKCIVKGKALYDPRDGGTRWSRNPALAIRDYLTNADYGLGCTAAEIDDATVIAAANICDEVQSLSGQPSQAVTVTAVDTTLDQLTLADNKMNLGHGDQVQISATTTVPGGTAAATNYYWIRVRGTGPTIAAIGSLATSYANALAAVAIDLTTVGSGTITITRTGHARYTCDGVIGRDEKPIDVVENILTAMAGVLVYSQGKFRMFAGAATTATVDLGASNLRADLQVKARPARRDLFNAVRGSFVDPGQWWQPTDFPPLTNATYAAQDNGEVLYRDIVLPFTTDIIRAQRIAKIHLEKSRQGISVTMPCNLSALQVAPWDVITLTDDALGWSDKEFRVLQWTLAEGGGVDLTLQEEAAASYDWNGGDATTIDPAPDTTLPSPLVIQPPGSPMATETLIETRSGAGVASQVTISWTQGETFAARYVVQYRLHGATTWKTAGYTIDTSFDILDLVAGTYDFQVATENTFGNLSAYAGITQQIFGLQARPGDVAGLTITILSGQAQARWTRAVDLDVLIGGWVRFRHSPATSGATWASSIDLAQVSGGAQEATLPAITGTYLAKFVDSTGNVSLNEATLATTLPDLIGFNFVVTVTESPAFSGAKSGVAVVDGILKLDSGSLVDDLGLIDDVAVWDAGSGVGSSGTYAFASTLDLGAVYTSRVTANLVVNVFNAIDLFDSRTGLIDSWDNFDGNVIAAVANAVLEVRTTSDDPAGSPTWGPWNSFVIGNYTARGFDFRLTLTSDDPAYNIQVSTLAVTVDMPDKRYPVSSTSSAGADTTITFPSAFKVTPKAVWGLQGAATGDYVEIVSISATACAYNVRNSSAARVAKAVDFTFVGY